MVARRQISLLPYFVWKAVLLYQYKNYRIYFSFLLLFAFSTGVQAEAINDLFWKGNPEHDTETSQAEEGIVKEESTIAIDNLDDDPLTLQEAEQLALETDSLIKKFDVEAVAFREKGVAAASLPDPKIKIGFMNLPADTFDFKQEDMTQQIIGVQQMFPPTNLLDYKGEQMDLMGVATGYKVVNQKREVLRSVRKAWLAMYLQHHAGNIVNKSDELFDQLVIITKSQYRSGRGNQQNVVRAQLEQSLLKDKEIHIKAMEDKAIAELGKWIDESQIKRSMSLGSLSLPAIDSRDALIMSLENHPALGASMASAQAAKLGIDVAKARYMPSWTVDFSYANRQARKAGGERSEFISLMFMVDLPLFTSNRQDKWVTASEKEYNSALYTVEERRKNLRRKLDAEYANWLRVSERLQHYRGTVLPQASQNAEAALKAYRSQVTEFNPLMRARLMELKIKLQALNLLVDRAQAQVNLLYLTGDGE